MRHKLSILSLCLLSACSYFKSVVYEAEEASMAVLATGGDRPAPVGPKQSGGGEQSGHFDLREEVEHRETGKMMGRRPCGNLIGAQPDSLVDNRPSSEDA